MLTSTSFDSSTNDTLTRTSKTHAARDSPCIGEQFLRCAPRIPRQRHQRLHPRHENEVILAAGESSSQLDSVVGESRAT